MSEFLGREYNYEGFMGHAGPGPADRPRHGEFALFKQIAHAGDEPPDFTLPNLDGRRVTLSELRGLPVVMEFGSIT